MSTSTIPPKSTIDIRVGSCYNGDMLIRLTQGKCAIIDDEDYDKVKSIKWYYSKHGNRAQTNKNGKTVYMARFILNDFTSYIIDHKNLNSLDNRKENLRPASKRQNGQNRDKFPKCSSQYKGVSWNYHMNRWCGTICINGKLKHLGYYSDEIEAAKQYDKIALKHFGEFAKLNFPGESK